MVFAAARLLVGGTAFFHSNPSGLARFAYIRLSMVGFTLALLETLEIQRLQPAVLRLQVVMRDIANVHPPGISFYL